MATTPLPYLASPGSIKTAFEKIRTAATPERVTGDFMNTKLQIKGGTGSALIPFLKKIGFVASDGAPTELYKRFRNPSIGGTAVAAAIKIGYSRTRRRHTRGYRSKRRLVELDSSFAEYKERGGKPNSKGNGFGRHPSIS